MEGPEDEGGRIKVCRGEVGLSGGNTNFFALFVISGFGLEFWVGRTVWEFGLLAGCIVHSAHQHGVYSIRARDLGRGLRE